MRYLIGALCTLTLLAEPARAQLSDAAILDTIQHAAFNFFWLECNPANGLIRDRNTSGSPASIASVGFGLTSICIGTDHGWVPRTSAAARVLQTLRTFWYGPQGDGNAYCGKYGLFYHFLDMSTATRTWDSELSTIDTGLLLAGIIDAREYFSGNDSLEQSIRGIADSLYRRMNWDFMRNYHLGILMGYQPGTGFTGYGEWIGYNEASIMYLLALGSPTHPVPSSAWQRWTSGYQWQTLYGYSYVVFPPLFGHQYTHCWIDFRSITDQYMQLKGITYFENSRRATLAQRAYAVANPGAFTGYSDSLWGLTASDTPTGYRARGAPPAQDDDGTITPTAPISSLAFAPEAALPVIRNLWNNYRAQLWSTYGFRDAFNPGAGWWDTDVIGIDQGPIIIMIENYRTGKVWERFMNNPDVQRGLQAAGFVPVTGVKETVTPEGYFLAQNYPNPFNPSTLITYHLSAAADVHLAVYDVLGREVVSLVDAFQEAGTHAIRFDARGEAAGVYICRLVAGRFSAVRMMVLLR